MKAAEDTKVIPEYVSLTVYEAENPEQGNNRCQPCPPIHVVSPLQDSARKRKKAVTVPG